MAANKVNIDNLTSVNDGRAFDIEPNYPDAVISGIHFGKVVSQGSGIQITLKGDSQGEIVLDDIDISGSLAYGVHIMRGMNVTIKRATLHDNAGYGVKLTHSFKNVAISNAKIYNNGFSGIMAYESGQSPENVHCDSRHESSGLYLNKVNVYNNGKNTEEKYNKIGYHSGIIIQGRHDNKNKQDIGEHDMQIKDIIINNSGIYDDQNDETQKRDVYIQTNVKNVRILNTSIPKANKYRCVLPKGSKLTGEIYGKCTIKD